VGPGGCARSNCDMECLGYEVDCDLQMSDSACDDCISANCLSECNACSANPECVALLQCAALCADTNCVTGCGLAHANGLVDANNYLGPQGCLVTRCPAPLCNLPWGVVP
jgi:hypothetical protein